jgi:tetratricopeptide (TPR) repeat protein
LRSSRARSWRTHPGAWLALVGALACGPHAPTPGGAPAPPDRIVLVSVDTLRADHLGCYGAARARTPVMDTVADAGVRFETAVSPVPLTLPAHATLMTGVDPPRHGVRHNSIQRLSDELPTLAERLRAAGYASAAFVGAVVLERRFGLARGFDVYDDRSAGRISADTGYAERPADAVVDAALAWLASAPERFFLWVHFYDPHADYAPPAGFASAFPGDPYAGEVAFVDAELGRLLAAIRSRFGETGLALLLTSDHGESLFAHGEPTHSHLLYEATQRVPLLLSGPGVPAGRVAAGPAGLVDVAPTLVAWAGAQPLPEAVGRDLRELALGAGDPERSLYMETLATQLDFGWSALFALRRGRFKYIRAPRPELYDLAQDPHEERDRAGEWPQLAAELDARLEAHRTGVLGVPQAVDLDEEQRARLRSLGYAVPESPPQGPLVGRVEGPDPKDRIEVLRELALAQAELSEGEAAAALARLDALPDAGTSLAAQRAAAALAAGDASRAEREARAVLAAEPARSDMRLLLARALASQGRGREAGLAVASLPADVAPAPWVALWAARAEAQAGRPEAALARLGLARARHPEDPGLALAAGGLLEGLGRPEEALAAREEALRLAPGDVAARNDVAWSLAMLGREPERALALAGAAAADGGDDPALLDTLARAQLAAGDPAAALATLERALPAASGGTREQLLELRERVRSRLDARDPPPARGEGASPRALPAAEGHSPVGR